MKKSNKVMEMVSLRNEITLTEKWSVSKAYETYGYNICSLWIDETNFSKKVSSCNGGGYDMQSTALSNFINMYFSDKLNTITENEYGLYSSHDGAKYITYGIGVNAIQKIVRHFGMTIEVKEVKVKRHYEKYITLKW